MHGRQQQIDNTALTDKTQKKSNTAHPSPLSRPPCTATPTTPRRTKKRTQALYAWSYTTTTTAEKIGFLHSAAAWMRAQWGGINIMYVCVVRLFGRRR